MFRLSPDIKTMNHKLNPFPIIFIFLLLLGGLPCLSVAQEQNDAIRIRPESGKIGKGSLITVYFSKAVVAGEAIDKRSGDSPLIFEPGIPGDFIWKSQTEGQFLVKGNLIPGQRYMALLAPGIRYLDGKPVNHSRWIDRTFYSPQLTVTTNFRSRNKSLSQQPRIALMLNYDIRFADAARAIYFQDRESRERFATEVLLPGLNLRPAPGDQPAPELGSVLFVQPAGALPAGRTVDIVVDGLRDHATGTPMPHLRSFPLGKTAALDLMEAFTLQDALADPAIMLSFNQRLAVESADASSISLTPQVANLKLLPSGSTIRLEGNFDPEGKYKITISENLRATTGFSPANTIAREVEFGGMTPSIYFPSTQYFTRPSLGLRMKFLHANTGPVTWQLGRLPEHKIGIARSRLFQDSERLIDQLGIQTVASGSFPSASRLQAIHRDINWRNEDTPAMANGVYLLEVSAPLSSGKLAANRSLIFFNDVFVTKKKTGDTWLAKVQDMSAGKPVTNVKVRMVTRKNVLLATARTDADGIVRFERWLLEEKRASHLLIDSRAGGCAVVFIGGETFHNSGRAWRKGPSLKPVGTIIADRNLYRPGTSAKFKGFLRHQEEGKLCNAPGEQIKWRVTEGYRGREIATGNTITDEFGGWEAEWKIPGEIKLGSYYMHARGCGYTRLQVEEYRTPLFEVDLKGRANHSGEFAQVNIQSNYFHGGPNAGALLRWSLDWESAEIDSGNLHTNDRYSETPLALPPLAVQEGELKLDPGGSALITVPIPEQAPYSRPRYGFMLNVDVISPEGRTVSSAFYGHVQPLPEVLGIDLDANYTGDAPALNLNVISLDTNDRMVAGSPFKADIFRVITRTVKERISEGLYRYRNFDEHLKVSSISALTPEAGTNAKPILIDVGGTPGRYVAVATLGPDNPRCSAPITLAGEARASYPQHAADSFKIRTDKEYYHPGETASLALEAPFAGKAWVSVETDRILEQFVVDLGHNASRIDLPIKPEYFPNVYATVHLVRPGEKQRIPNERFGRVELNVKRVDLQLEVNPVMAQSRVEPGAVSTGTVYVLSGGKPVKNADVTLMAVDEAVLQLGAWQAQELAGVFYPERGHHVATYPGLLNHVASFNETDVAEKGFVIGGGDVGGSGAIAPRKKQPRRDFRPRAFWITSLRTDALGRASFSFKAPENMTEFRVTAIAQTKDLQFGQGQSKFQVSKRLMIEPALPRFVRHGDELILRAVTRHKLAQEADVLVSCKAGPGLETLSPPSANTGLLAPNVPGTFGQRVRVKRGVSEIKVRFDARIAGQSDITDEVEITLPVFQPGIMQRVAIHGKLPGNAAQFVLAKATPRFWPEAEGDFGITLSRSPFMPKLQGLPELLEYPHGCFEQRTSKLLGYTQLAGLLEYLPNLGQRHKNYRQRIEEGLQYISQHIHSDGFLSYWPGRRGTSHPYVTIQAAWVVAECRRLGYEIPQKIENTMPRAIDAVIRGRKKSNAATRAFALFVNSMTNDGAKPVDVIEEIYLNRDRVNDETRSMLAMAMKNYGVMGEEQKVLCREIDIVPSPQSFNPSSFSSPTRARAVAYMAQSRINDPQWQHKLEPEMRSSLLAMMDDSRHLSTQENLWLLMALTTMLSNEDYHALAFEGSGADMKSNNGFSMAWKRRALSSIQGIELKMDTRPAYYLVDANVLRDMENSKREDRGIRVERVVKNMTDATRNGSAENPLMLGDEILITYRLQSDKNHHYIALVDELPAAMETINFNLAQVAEFFSLPKGSENNSLHLDHSELRDRSANLYFNNMPEGSHTYSILARVTSKGRFSWPATSVTPMYEPRFGALGASQWIFVSSD